MLHVVLCLDCRRKENWFLERKQIIQADKSLCNQILKVQTSGLAQNVVHEFEKLCCSKLEDSAPHLTLSIV